MDKKIFFFAVLFSFVAAILQFGCVAYYPQVVNIPLIKEKNDLRINAGVFLVPDFSETENVSAGNDVDESEWLGNVGGHVTVSYGISDFLSIQGFASVDMFLRYHLQAALGAYCVFGAKTVMELYGGAGYGSGYLSTLFWVRDSYTLPFLQLNLGQTGVGSMNFDYGFGLKNGYIFCRFSNELFDTESVHKKNGWMFEPSVFFRFGSKRVKYSAMVNYLWTKTIHENYYFPVNIGMGASIHLGNKAN